MRKGTGYSFEIPFTGSKITAKCPCCRLTRFVHPKTKSSECFCDNSCREIYSKHMKKMYKEFCKLHFHTNNRKTVAWENRLIENGQLPMRFARTVQGLEV